jgi:phenylalanyl-tRNA synthetase alpha subunit
MSLEGFFALSENITDHDETEAERDQRMAVDRIVAHSFVTPKPGTTLGDLGIVPTRPKEKVEVTEAEQTTQCDQSVASTENESAGMITLDVDRKEEEREKKLHAQNREAKLKKRTMGSHAPHPRYQNGGSHTNYD